MMYTWMLNKNETALAQVYVLDIAIGDTGFDRDKVQISVLKEWLANAEKQGATHIHLDGDYDGDVTLTAYKL